MKSFNTYLERMRVSLHSPPPARSPHTNVGSVKHVMTIASDKCFRPADMSEGVGAE
jgi:hypothetical protein